MVSIRSFIGEISTDTGAWVVPSTLDARAFDPELGFPGLDLMEGLVSDGELDAYVKLSCSGLKEVLASAQHTTELTEDESLTRMVL